MIPSAFIDVWDLQEGQANVEALRRAVASKPSQRVLQARQLDHRELHDIDVEMVLDRGELARLDELLFNTRGAQPVAYYLKGANALAWSLDLIKGTAIGVTSYGWVPTNGAVETLGALSPPFGSATPHLLRGGDDALEAPRLVQQVGPFVGDTRGWHVKVWIRQHFAEYDRLAINLAQIPQALHLEIKWAAGVPSIVGSSTGVQGYIDTEAPVSGWYPVELTLDPVQVTWSGKPGGHSSLVEVYLYTAAAFGTGGVGTYDLANLITSPHDFTTTWTGPVTVTADQVAGPFFAAVTADKLDATVAAQQLSYSVSGLTDGDDYGFSVYLLADTAARADIALGDSSSSSLLTHASLDFGTGVATLQTSIGTGSHNVYLEKLATTAPGAPTGWYRLGVDVTNVNATTGGTLKAAIAPAGLTASTGAVFAWGARLDHEHDGGVADPNPYAWRGNALHGISAGVGRGPLAAAYHETRGEAEAPLAVQIDSESVTVDQVSAVKWRARVRLTEVPI